MITWVSGAFLVVYYCDSVAASFYNVDITNSTMMSNHIFNVQDEYLRAWYSRLVNYRKPPTLSKMLTMNWEDFFEARRHKVQFTIKADPDNMFFAQMPNDIPNQEKATLQQLIEYNLARVHRHFVTLRSKAVMSPYCSQGMTNPFTSNKMVQLYHNAFEPFEIPCYTCDPRVVHDGRPKVWFSVYNRTYYDSITGLQFKAVELSSLLSASIQIRNYRSGEKGAEWQVDQTAGENIANRPGGSLFINPERSDDEKASEISQTGMYFCASVDPEKHKRSSHPEDFLENSVIISVDVNLGRSMSFSKAYYSTPQLYNPSKFDACTPKGGEINLECFLSWQPWSCPKVCDNAEPSKQVTRSRMGYISFKKRDLRKPIGISCLDVFSTTKAKSYPLCMGTDVMFNIPPYDTQGIPVYSSYWLDYRQYYHSKLLERFNVPWETEYLDVKVVTCGDMTTDCSNVPGYHEEVTMAPLVYTAVSTAPVTMTPKISTTCAKDLFKHTDIFVPKKTTFMQLNKGKSYRFFCGQTKNENEKAKIFWRTNNGKSVAPTCTSSLPVFQYKNELHVHDSSVSDTYACEFEHEGKKRFLYGKAMVNYVEPTDWHSIIMTSVGTGLIMLITCGCCFWCGRGVKNVTKSAVNLATEGAVVAADFYLMGAAGQFMEGRKAADQERERQMLAKEDEIAHKAIEDALRKKRKKKAKE